MEPVDMVSPNGRGNLLTPQRQQHMGNQSSNNFITSTISPDGVANNLETTCQLCTPSNPSDHDPTSEGVGCIANTLTINSPQPRGREVVPDSPLIGFVKKGNKISYRRPLLDDNGNTVQNAKGVQMYKKRAVAKIKKGLKLDAYNEKRRKMKSEGNNSTKMNDGIGDTIPALETTMQTKDTSENTQTHNHGSAC